MKDAIRSLNRAHYSDETRFYSTADLRPVEVRLIDSVAPHRRILDVGCGAGRVTHRLAEAGHHVTGIDLVPETVNAARNAFAGLNLDLHVGDMCAMPFESDMFDEVWCLRFSFNALGSREERVQALREMKRVCKPGGRLLVESFNYLYPGRFGLMWAANLTDELSRWLRILAGSPAPRLPRGDILYLASKAEHAAPGYAHLPTSRELEDLCNEASLEGATVGAAEHPFGLFRHRLPLGYSIWIRGGKGGV